MVETIKISSLIILYLYKYLLFKKYLIFYAPPSRNSNKLVPFGYGFSAYCMIQIYFHTYKYSDSVNLLNCNKHIYFELN